jgi:hypothetical protein
MNAPFLSWLENAAIRFLISSPRISMIHVKQHGTLAVYGIKDGNDPTNAGFWETEKKEPASMKLERLYHSPSFGEHDD